jgi:hypothetical protein
MSSTLEELTIKPVLRTQSLTQRLGAITSSKNEFDTRTLIERQSDNDQTPMMYKIRTSTTIFHQPRSLNNHVETLPPVQSFGKLHLWWGLQVHARRSERRNGPFAEKS